MKQITFSELDYLSKRKITRKERFIAEMEQVVPFARLEAVVVSHFPKTDAKDGGPPKSLAMMLRVYMLQNWLGYSDPGMEEAVYDIEAWRRFVGVNPADAEMPDKTTILNIRRMLETHQLTEALFTEINAHLCERDLTLKSGAIVAAGSGAVHMVDGSTASLLDSQKAEDCLHGEAEGVLSDSAYCSKEKPEALVNKGTILLTPTKAKTGRKLHDL